MLFLASKIVNKYNNFRSHYSVSNYFFNYRSQCLHILQNSSISSRYFEHIFFREIAAKYETRIKLSNTSKLESAAQKVLNQPFLAITEKKLTPINSTKSNYLSFVPYYWQLQPAQPLNKARNKPIYRDGEVNPYLAKLSDKPKLAQLCARIHLLTLASLLNPNDSYIDYINQQLSIWFINSATKMKAEMEYAQIKPWTGQRRGRGIIDSRWLILLLDALSLLKHKTEKSIDKDIERCVINWIKEFAIWILKSRSGQTEVARRNNRGSWVDVVLCYIGLTINEHQLTNMIIDFSLANRIQQQVDPKGLQPFELKRTKPVSYSLYNIYPLYYIYQIASHLNFKNKQSQIKDLLKGSEDKLLNFIAKHEKGQIEHIDFSVNFDLNLYYPYSMAQLEHFPCLLPFTRD